MKKYEFTRETKELVLLGVTLHRIRALVDIVDEQYSTIKAGTLGGWIEKEENLSQENGCWIHDDAFVYDNAKVYGNARIRDNACVYGNAEVYDYARIHGKACVRDNAKIYGDACVFGDARIRGKAKIYDNAEVYDNAKVYDNAEIACKARIENHAQIYDNAKIRGTAVISANAQIYGNANISGNTYISYNACISSNARIRCSDDVLFIDSVGKFDGLSPNMTFFKAGICEVKVSYELFTGRLHDFLNFLEENNSDYSKYEAVYRTSVKLAKLHFNSAFKKSQEGTKQITNEIFEFSESESRGWAKSANNIAQKVFAFFDEKLENLKMEDDKVRVALMAELYSNTKEEVVDFLRSSEADYVFFNRHLLSPEYLQSKIDDEYKKKMQRINSMIKK